MLTQYKREDLEEVIMGNHNLQNEFSLIADKLKVLYSIFGYNQTYMDEADNVVELCSQNVLEDLLSEDEQAEFGQAGLLVRGWWIDDFLMLDYSFKLI